MSSTSSNDVAVGAGDTDSAAPPPYARNAENVVTALGSDFSMGLTGAESAVRLVRYGPNQITAEKPPSMLAIALIQLRDPMHILLNLVLGTRQELKARASVDALSNQQVPQAKVVRDGALILVPATDVVPGDLVQVEAGDIVPADGRITRSATLETQEAALTGESAPVAKDAGTLTGSDVALGD